MHISEMEPGPARIREAARLLRDREQWPVGFEWDYGSPWGCLMGFLPHFYVGCLFDLGLSLPEAEFIGVELHEHLRKTMEMVTPYDVARALEEIAAGKAKT